MTPTLLHARRSIVTLANTGYMLIAWRKLVMIMKVGVGKVPKVVGYLPTQQVAGSPVGLLEP